MWKKLVTLFMALSMVGVACCPPEEEEKKPFFPSTSNRLYPADKKFRQERGCGAWCMEDDQIRDRWVRWTCLPKVRNGPWAEGGAEAWCWRYAGINGDHVEQGLYLP